MDLTTDRQVSFEKGLQLLFFLSPSFTLIFFGKTSAPY